MSDNRKQELIKLKLHKLNMIIIYILIKERLFHMKQFFSDCRDGSF